MNENKALISIKPEYVEKILAGDKVYEYRKTKFRKDIDSIIIYSTSPEMKVVAEVKVVGIIEGSPESVWEKTRTGAGIDKAAYDRYYCEKNYAVAFCLGEVSKFSPAKTLSDYNIKSAPQSFVYV